MKKNRIKIFAMAYFIFVFCTLTYAQTSSFSAVDAKMLAVPRQYTRGTQQLANWINSNFRTDDNKLRAIFIWITSNMTYDLNINLESFKNKEQMINYAMQNHRGVCSHFSYLFADLAQKTGVKTEVVRGYVRINGVPSDDGHQWCAAFCGGQWFLYDPTWGAGYMSNNQFVHSIQNEYYKMTPQQAIKQYMPFDPMFQFLDYPLTYNDFNNNYRAGQGKYFNWRDSIANYEQQTEYERYIHVADRIKNNGSRNSAANEELAVLNANIGIEHANAVIDVYNTALTYYNNGITMMNKFISYRNNQFKPYMPQGDVYAILRTSASDFNKAFNLIDDLCNADYDLQNEISILKTDLIAKANTLLEHKNFADKYYSTDARFRDRLFVRRYYYRY